MVTNRSALQQSLALPAPPRWLRQVHGINVAELGPLPSPDEPQADAAVSHIPGTVLAILTADCLPVLFCADDGSEIGAAHAGWRGLAAGVLEADARPSCIRPADDCWHGLGHASERPRTKWAKRCVPPLSSFGRGSGDALCSGATRPLAVRSGCLGATAAGGGRG